jgi:hypothetical protein
MPPVLFAFLIFGIGSSVYAWPGLDCYPPIYASCLAEMTGMHHHGQLLLVDVESLELFAQVGLEQQSSRHLPPR